MFTIVPEPVQIPDFIPLTEGNWIRKHRDGRTRNLRLLKITHEPEGDRLWFDDLRTGQHLSMLQSKFEKLIRQR